MRSITNENIRKIHSLLDESDGCWMTIETDNDRADNDTNQQYPVHLQLLHGQGGHTDKEWFWIYDAIGFDIILGQHQVHDICRTNSIDHHTNTLGVL